MRIILAASVAYGLAPASASGAIQPGAAPGVQSSDSDVQEAKRGEGQTIVPEGGLAGTTVTYMPLIRSRAVVDIDRHSLAQETS